MCASLSRGASRVSTHARYPWGSLNEALESRSNFVSRFKIARPVVNTSGHGCRARGRNIRTRYAFHSARYISVSRNQTLFFLTHVSLVYFNLRHYLSHFSLFLRLLLLSPRLPHRDRGVFAPCTFKHHGVAFLPTLIRERSCPECNVFGDS